MEQEQKEIVERTLIKVVMICRSTLASLREKEKNEIPWNEDDEARFQLSGSFLTLYEKKNLNTPKVQQLLLLTAHACTHTISHYETIGRDQWDNDDVGLNLLCRCYLYMYNRDLKNGNLTTGIS